jgi:methanethiol S-methyltransferase
LCGGNPITPFLILLAVSVYGFTHSLLASHRVKAAARRSLGAAADRYYRLAYNIFGAVSLLPVLVVPILLPDRHVYTAAFPWSLLLLAVQALALIGLGVGVRQTGTGAFLGLKQLVEPQPVKSELVTAGLYQWVRHPLYSAGIVFLWASPVMTRNLFALFLGLTAYLMIGAMFEERKLKAEFGAAYDRYREQTPMFIPGLKGLKRK